MDKRAYHINYRRALVRLANKYRVMVYAALNNQGTDPLNLDETELKQVLYKLHTEAAILNARRVFRSLSKVEKKSNDELWREAIEMYLTNGGLFIQNITETTRKNILAIIKEGESLGLGSNAISRMISEKLPEINRNRALLITRTELTTAMNTGSFMAVNSFGKVVNKEWISTTDNRTRRIPRNDYDHLHMNEVQTSYDGYFIIPSTKTVDAMQFPGDPNASAGNLCNCRCTMAMIPVRDNEGRMIPLKANPPQIGVAAQLYVIMQTLTAGLLINQFVTNDTN